MPRDTQFGRDNLARFLRGNILCQNAVFHQIHDTVLRILIKLLGHDPNFPIYSDGTKPGALQPVSKRYIHAMLSNKYYLGILTYCGVEYPGNHEPLIAQGLFDRVQQTLSSRRQGERRRKHDHLLKSTAWCGDCGSRIILQKPTNHQGLQYEYFACNGGLSKRTTCHLPAVPVEWLEGQIEELYRRIQVPREILDLLRPRLKEQLQLHNTSRDEERDQLKAQE